MPLERLDGFVPGDLATCGRDLDVLEMRDGQVHMRGWAVTPGLPPSAVGIAAFNPKGRRLGYARPWELRWDKEKLSGMSVVLGCDFWFPQAKTARDIDLVALLSPGAAHSCRVPKRDPNTTLQDAGP